MRIKLQEGAYKPERSTSGSVGYDLRSIEDVLLYPDTYTVVHTGVHVEIPTNIAGIISHRSGLNSNQGIQAYGTADPDYRGELKVTLFNNNPTESGRVYQIKKGDKIAQIVFTKVWCPTLEVVDSLNETKRGECGHGSTGR